MKTLILGLLVVAVSTVNSALAKWEIDESTLRLPPPPAVGSAGEERDFAILLRYQAKRTAEECESANRESIPTMKALFGHQLSSAELAEVKDFAKETLDTVFDAAEPFKKKWERKRPYDVNSEIEPCVRKPGGHTSYPSSHAAAGVLMGEVLAKVYPAKKELLLKQGLHIGENRLLGGVHHPSDVEAGRLLGTQVLKQLQHNDEFREALSRLGN